jgi:hypothetical protein
MADVEHGLNRALQVAFGVPVDQRISHGAALVGQSADLPQQGHGLANPGNPRRDDEPIDHGRTPRASRRGP